MSKRDKKVEMMVKMRYSKLLSANSIKNNKMKKMKDRCREIKKKINIMMKIYDVRDNN
jgi:hypothetical protein